MKKRKNETPAHFAFRNMITIIDAITKALGYEGIEDENGKIKKIPIKQDFGPLRELYKDPHIRPSINEFIQVSAVTHKDLGLPDPNDN